jgi:all-trans-8'-apo-beta-carotenal 15,15'-oxygenase
MSLLNAGFINARPPEIPEPTPLSVEGELPTTLRGVLYRNGTGQFTVHGDRYRHLFDGDGLVTRLALEEEGAFYTSRFVRTIEKQKEDDAGKRIFGTYATRPMGGAVRRFIHREFKNVSNTNLVHQWGHVFSLYEGGPPYKLDPETLETIGPELFEGRLADQRKVSAHPHRDPKSGDLWGFGITRKRETTLTVYNMTHSGNFEAPFQTVIPYSGIVHDFAFTANHIIFIVPPVKLPKIPLGIILGQRSFYESIEYHPEEETCVVIIDRRTGNERRCSTEPFMNFHIANAWEEAGLIHVDLCNFEDFSVMKTMADLVAGTPPKKTVSFLERLTIDGSTVTRRRLCDTSMEFPRTVEAGWSAKCRYYYGASWADRDWMGVPVRYDVETGACQTTPMPPHLFAGEPVPVPKANGEVDSVWLLYTVLDTRNTQSEIYIADGDDMTAPPIARIALPQRIPLQLHGNWVPMIGPTSR